MSIADKLQTIANNLATESEVVEQQTELLQQIRTALVGKTVPGDPGDSGSYDEGYADGQQDVLDVVNYELAGRGLEEVASVDEIPHKLDDAFITLESNGYESGKKSQYDAFWDAYQDNGKRNQYVYAFAQVGWTDSTYAPKYPIVGYSYGLQQAFTNASKITDTKVPLILQNGSMRATFNLCDSLKRIPSLVLQVPTTDTTSTFNGCYNLEEINIVCEGEGGFATSVNLAQSSKLSAESVQSIIDALKDLTGQTAQTITFHKDMQSRVTPDQKMAIDAKNWTQVY
jgi:hypothetical protein